MSSSRRDVLRSAGALASAAALGSASEVAAQATAPSQSPGAADATMVVSTMSNVTLEDVAAVATRPLWFQLYVQPDRELTRQLVRRAETAGYQALVVTVDAPVLGPRYRELRANFALPPKLE